MTLTRVFLWIFALGVGPDVLAFVWAAPWGPWVLGAGVVFWADISWNAWRTVHHDRNLFP